MGAFGTWCQVCWLPVQHTHLVPEDEPDHYRIYRGDPELDGDLEPVVRFGPEHAWLEHAVAVALDDSATPPLVTGKVQDGEVEGPEGSAFVADGVDLHAAAHRVCWEMLGSSSGQRLLDRRPPPTLVPYLQQFFDFASFAADGHGWMLADPRGDSDDAKRSRARIERLIAAIDASR